MVESVDLSDEGLVRLTVLLTVAGCPLKDTINRDVTTAVGGVEGVTGVDLDARRDECRAAGGSAGDAARRTGTARDPVRAAGLAHPGPRDRERQGRCRQVVGDGQPGAGDGCHGPQGRDRRRRHLRPQCAGDAGRRRPPPDPGRGADHARSDGLRRLGDLDRDAQATSRPGRRVARPDARPGPGPDALRRLLGRPRRPPPRPAAGHRRRGDLARPAPAGRRGAGGDDSPGGRRRGGRARRARWRR